MGVFPRVMIRSCFSDQHCREWPRRWLLTLCNREYLSMALESFSSYWDLGFFAPKLSFLTFYTSLIVCH